MKIKNGFIVRRVAGQNVALATGEAGKDFNSMIKLNGTALDIWNGIDQGLSETEIADLITEKYDVDSEKALSDVKSFTARLSGLGIVED